MASGFVIYPNGKSWCPRWSIYDAVLTLVKDVLSSIGAEAELKTWIAAQLPDYENGDVESGYCFYKEPGGDCIIREIDSRNMKPEYAAILWETIDKLCKDLEEENPFKEYVVALSSGYKRSLTDIIPSADQHGKADEKIGPGWS